MADSIELQYVARMSKYKEVLDEFTADHESEIFSINEEKINEICLLSRPNITNEILYGKRNPIDLNNCKRGTSEYARGLLQKWFLDHLDYPYMTDSEFRKCASEANVPVLRVRQILISIRKQVRARFRAKYPMYVSFVCCKEHCPCCTHYKNYVL